MKDRKINHIFFDYARTIVAHPADSAGITIIRDTGLEDENDIQLIKKYAFSVEKYLNPLDEGTMTRDTYKKMLAAEIPARLYSYAVKAVDYPMMALPLLPGMKELIVKLKTDGYKIYITSNLDAYHMQQMCDTEIAPYTDGMLFSAEINVRKPYPAFFDAACKKFGVSPDKCLFIDDLEENVRGARNFGIKSFVFRGDPKETERFIYAET